MSKDWKFDSQFVSRRNIFFGASAVMFGGLALRLAELQLLRGQEYETLAKENRIRLEASPAHRGLIYDRKGTILAGNKRNFYVTLTPELAGSKQDVVNVVDRLCQLLPISEARRKRILRDASRQARFVEIVVADDLSWDDFARINVLAPELGGVQAKVGEQRSYPFGAAFAHSIGYVARANDADIARLIEDRLARTGDAPDSPAGVDLASGIRRLYKHPQMRIGRQGIEAFAEESLRGSAGKVRVLVNAAGRPIDTLPSEDIAGERGKDLVLSLDSDIQKYAIQRFGAEAGSATVVHIQSGEIVALVSTPGFDPNDFVSGISSTDYRELLADERAPLFHKAYDGAYPPGSTYKVVVAAAALETGVMKPEDRIHCSGRVWYGNRFFHCWQRRGHGSVDLHGAIQKSCDVYFYEAARRIGIEKLAEVSRRFGLGHRYELGLTGGVAGVVPDGAWKQRVKKEPWYEGETLSVGIGQGYMNTSPFQLAVMTARVAAGKLAANPKLILGGLGPADDGIAPFEGVSDETLAHVRAGMFAVTSEAGGTALRAGAIDPNNELPAPFTGARLAGKTGTAQVRVITMAERATGVLDNKDLAWRMRDHALFICYAPADNPLYACSVVVDHGGGGSAVAAPIARDILAATLRLDPAGKPAFEPKPQMAQAATKGETG